MKQLLVWLFVLCCGAATAQEPVAPNTDIQDVITQQLELFQQDDFEQAFTLASPSIRNVFQTPERFGQMVTQGYPMVHRPQSYAFQELRDVAGRLWQKLLIEDMQGALYHLEYQMIETESGWKINAVQITPLPSVGV